MFHDEVGVFIYMVFRYVPYSYYSHITYVKYFVKPKNM